MAADDWATRVPRALMAVVVVVVVVVAQGWKVRGMYTLGYVLG